MSDTVVQITNQNIEVSISSPDTILIDVGNHAVSDVLSFNGRTGAVVPATDDYTWAQLNKTGAVASGVEVDAGTDNNKYVTCKAIEDSSYAKESTVPLKASGAEINTGTDDAKFATPKAIADSNIAFTSDVPSKATGAEINTGSDDAKFVTPKAITDSYITKLFRKQLYTIMDNYTVLDDDGYEVFSFGVGPTSLNLNLPTVADNIGRVVTVIKSSPGGVGTVVTITPEGAETINGVNAALTLNGVESVTLVAQAVGWSVTGKYLNIATGAEINTGTDDLKYVTPKAIADSNVAFTSDIPVKASGAEVDTGTDDAKYVTAKAMEDSSYAKTTAIPSKASSADLIAGTDDAKFATALALAGSDYKTLKAKVKIVTNDDYTILDNDGYEWISVGCGLANRTVTLPTLADNIGRVITIVKSDFSSPKVTVVPEGIDGLWGTAFELLHQNHQVTVIGVDDGSYVGWLISRPPDATSAQINDGTNVWYHITPSALAGSDYAKTAAIPTKASSTEIKAGTDDAKFATSRALKDAGFYSWLACQVFN
jgi:hypothetical protein